MSHPTPPEVNEVNEVNEGNADVYRLWGHRWLEVGTTWMPNERGTIH